MSDQRTEAWSAGPPGQPDDPRVEEESAVGAHSGKATAALVLGIIGLVFVLCSLFSWLLILPCLVVSTLAIILGYIGAQEIQADPRLQGEAKAKAGMIMGIIGVSLALVSVALVFIFLAANS